MKISEQDFFFFILSIIGIIGGPIVGGIMIYAHFYRNPTHEPLWILFVALVFIALGMTFCIKHIKDCWNQMKA